MFLELVKKSSPPLGGAQFRQDRVFLSLLLAVRQSGGKTKKAAVGQPSDVELCWVRIIERST